MLTEEFCLLISFLIVSAAWVYRFWGSIGSKVSMKIDHGFIEVSQPLSRGVTSKRAAIYTTGAGARAHYTSRRVTRALPRASQFPNF